MNFWVKIMLVLVVVWLVAGGAIFWARSARPTARSITAYVDKNDLSSLSGPARRAVIERLAGMLNRVSIEEREELRRNRVTERFFRSLTPGEQGTFLDMTLPAGFKQMMESFNKMDPVKRKEFVNRALEEMKKHEGEEPPRNMDDANVQRMINQGMKSFYSEASAETKLDLAPLIEQMQRNLQSPR